MLAVATIIAWGVTGPLFDYPDTWQLIINTGTTIITFLMVFLIQNTQNRDTAAIQLKLDELIRANQNARNMILCLEDLGEKDLEKLKRTFAALAPSEAVAAKIQTAPRASKRAARSSSAPRRQSNWRSRAFHRNCKEHRAVDDDRTIRDAADRTRINMQEDYEVRYWTQKWR